MSRRNGDRRPYVRPVTRIELSEQNIKLRWILIAVLLSIAAVAIGMGFYHVLNVQPGWNEVTVSSNQPNCSSEFKLMYDFSDYGGNASAANKQIQSLYTQAAEDGHTLFSPDIADAGTKNVHYVNANVNHVVSVEKALYDAFALLNRFDNRNLYLAPVYVEYNRVFNSESDVNAAEYDPNKNPEVRAYIEAVMTFVKDPRHIRLELLENDQVRLYVSDAYLDFAEEYGIENFLDFGWMKNAFLADYMADQLADAGFTCGYLASYDGYTRNLDSREVEYSFNLFDRRDNTISIPAELKYEGAMSIVYLRNYPLTDEDRWHYYSYENGQVTTVYLNSATGMDVSSTDNLVAYSQGVGCAEILMRAAPLFIAENLDLAAVQMLTGEGIHCIWAEDHTLYHSQKDAKVNQLRESGGGDYQIQYAQ